MLNDGNIYKIGMAYAACTSVLDLKRKTFIPQKHIHNPTEGLNTVYLRVIKGNNTTPIIEELMSDAMNDLDVKDVGAIAPCTNLGNWWIGYYHYKNGKENEFEFNQKLKVERTNKRLTQKEVAELLGISLKTYMNWEENVSEPNQITQDTVLQRLQKISQNTLD